MNTATVTGDAAQSGRRQRAVPGSESAGHGRRLRVGDHDRPGADADARPSTSTVVFPGTAVTYTYDGNEQRRHRPAQRHRQPGLGHRRPVLAGRAGADGRSYNVGDVEHRRPAEPERDLAVHLHRRDHDGHRQHRDDPGPARRPERRPGRRRTDPATRSRSCRSSTRASSITKTALVPVVLDPDAEPIIGPDIPTPRPAEYLYEVANTGDVPLADVEPPDDDYCDDVTFLEGDVDTDEILDVDEVWVYTCETTLDRAGTTPTPAGQRRRVRRGDEHRDVSPAPRSCPTIRPSTGPESADADTAQVHGHRAGHHADQDRIRGRRPRRTATSPTPSR